MKIGIDISQTVFEGTGTAVYTKNLVENLLKVDPKNQYCFFGASLRRRQKNFWPIPPTALEILWNQWHIMPVENFVGPIDVFHSSDWTQPPSKAKKVTTIHDLIVYKFPESSHPRIIAAQKRRLVWVKKEVDKIIAVSESTKKDIVEILKIPEEKIKVVYEAANMKAPQDKYQNGKPYILAVGTREPRKNFNRLIEAFKKIKNKDTDLLIAGKAGWGLEETSGVKILGYIPPEKLAQYYAGAQAFVYPSLYEGFGLPILEAFNCCCPVITSNISSMPEVGGKAAIYVDPLDVNDITEKINWVLSLSTAKRNEIITLGKSQTEKFSWEKCAQETIKIYEEIAGL